MSRALIRLTLATSAPPLLQPRGDLAVVTRFGRWLRDECRRLSRRWPASQLDQLQLQPGEVIVLVHFSSGAPPLVAALALSRWLQGELAAAAHRSGWLGGEEMLWESQQVVVTVPREIRCAPFAAAPVPAGRRDRSWTRRPVPGR